MSRRQGDGVSVIVKQNRPVAMATFPLTTRAFGHLPSGESVEAWTLCGAGGLVLEVITYGAIVTQLKAPDRNGRLADVVLGFNNIDSYLADRAYVGAVIGRVAGRITGGRFNLEGNTYELARNEPPNHLHGGFAGFSTKVWHACPQNDSHAPSLSLMYKSLHGEEGYPGTVDVVVAFTVRHDNVLLVETKASADRATPFSLTFHHYFNLAGEAAGSIADHELQIHSSEYVPTDECMALLGRLEPVAGRENDLRRSRNLGDVLPLLIGSHGDLYCIRRTSQQRAESQLTPAARLLHPGSGLALEVSTTADYLQLYSGSGLDGSAVGKSGIPYARHAGVCLECEGYPDGANVPQMGDIILRPGFPRRETTAYAFQVA
ncbi:MAG: aldose epimerase family protein [Terracidiphilus sp.]